MGVEEQVGWLGRLGCQVEAQVDIYPIWVWALGQLIKHEWSQLKPNLLSQIEHKLPRMIGLGST